jgi:RNase P protein component
MREAVRLTRVWPGAAADIVINPKKIVLTADFETVLNEVRQAFIVIEKRLGGKADGDGSRSAKPQG